MRSHLLLMMILLSALLYSCTAVPPIVEEICEITTEICYYADAICNNIPPSVVNSEQAQLFINQLSNRSQELFRINQVALESGGAFSEKEREQLIFDLIRIRDNLKNLYLSLP